MQVLWIGVGGFVGAIARYGLSGWVSRVAGGAFPWGTFAVNASGSFALAAVFTALTERALPHPMLRTALAVGFLGAFTTFSTFAFETVRLLEDGALALAAANVGGSVAACLAGVYGGMWLGRTM